MFRCVLHALAAMIIAWPALADAARPFPAHALRGTLVVHYTLESHGLVHDVWILTPDELARRPWPATVEEAQRWSFDPGTQVWTPR